jgi:peptide/nickel transport system ATP-binding protein
MNQTEPGPVLSVEDLRTVIHTERGTLPAVDGVSFTVGRGEMFGIVGESGSGKSVLGRTVMGLYSNGPSMTVTGKAVLDGTDVHALSDTERRKLWGTRVGMIFQDPTTALNPVKRVGRHLTESLRRHGGLSRAAARTRAEELLALVGIPEPRRRLDQYPHELSGGMRQRVVIAMALAGEPSLLIADEPTTALDVTVQKQILDLLARLQSELGTAIVLISHNLAVVAGRADRVAVMYAGRMAETAPADALFERPRHPYTEALLASVPQLGDPPHTTLQAIEGTPPNIAALPAGCRFAPRCRHAELDCQEALPALVPAGGNEHGSEHAFACFHPIGSRSENTGSENTGGA